MAPVDAQKRWASLVRARRRESERLRPGAGAVGPDFWNRRARLFAGQMAGTAERDPFLPRVRRACGRSTTVLDVGAGSGRFTLALAPGVAHVTAVDPSKAMLSIVRSEARRQGLTNVSTVLGRWEEVGVPPADVVICSFVLPMIEDAAGFLRKLDVSARHRAFLYLSGLGLDAPLDPLWRHFHGRPRSPSPTYLDAAAVLEEIGVEPEIEVVEVPVWSRYPTVAEAARRYRESLLLPDTAEARRELRKLLSSWLVKLDGQLCPPFRTLPSAVVSWTPGGRT